MSVNPFLLQVEQHIPVAKVSIYQQGAIVNGAQDGVTTVTVHAPHGLTSGDKFFYAADRRNMSIWRDRIFTVDSVTSTTVTFTGSTFSFPDKSLLVSIGADSAAAVQSDGSYSMPDWDGSTVTVYKDPAGDDAWTNGIIDSQPDGEFLVWGATTPVWAICRDNGERPTRIYTDLSSGGAAGLSTVAIARGTSLPGSPTLGDVYTLVQASTPDIKYQYMKLGDNAEDWVEVIRAPTTAP